MTNGFFKVEDYQKAYEEALVREAIICSLKGKVACIICYLGHNASNPPN